MSEFMIFPGEDLIYTTQRVKADLSDFILAL